MSIKLQVKKDVALENKFIVDGKDYASLDQVPPEIRALIERALAAGGAASKITVNGQQYASWEDVPGPLRTILRGLTVAAVNSRGGTTPAPPAEALRPEPVVSAKAIVIIVLIAVLVWLARLL